jgi:adenine-specific DNA-methyltransferase
MTDSIRGGHVAKKYWLFFPHSSNGALFPNEDAVRNAVPRYFEQYLQPNRTRLETRATIIQSRRADWWGLMRSRAWSLSARPRILTKFFGAEGAFVGDFDAALFAVMGHVWTLKPRIASITSTQANMADEAAEEQLTETDLLAAFVALCNSTPFSKLLAFYAPHVAGGQYDLSARHVGPIPIPDLQLLALDPVTGSAVRSLSALGRQVNLGSAEWRGKATEAVSYLYGGIEFDAL